MNGSFTADEYRRTVWTPALSAYLSPQELSANWKFSISAFEVLLPLSNPFKRLSEIEYRQLGWIIEELKTGKPIQYIAEKAPFLHYWLKVNSCTLIPRPETEELVELIGKKMSGLSVNRIVDVGTGSGCIAIGLQDQFKEAEVFAVDVAEDTLEVAKMNFASFAPKIQPIRNNVLLDEFPAGYFDVIVSNPPYIPVNELELLDKRVADHEPHQALFTPDEDPLLFYRIITDQAKMHLSNNGILAFETHFQYAEEVRKLVADKGFKAELYHDMQGLPRMIIAARDSN